MTQTTHSSIAYLKVVTFSFKGKKDTSGNLGTEVKQEVDVMADYLQSMHTDDNGTIILDEIPEGYQLSYRRRSQRQTYHYDSNGLPCRLTVCKETSEELVGKDESKPHVSFVLLAVNYQWLKLLWG